MTTIFEQSNIEADALRVNLERFHVENGRYTFYIEADALRVHAPHIEHAIIEEGGSVAIDKEATELMKHSPCNEPPPIMAYAFSEEIMKVTLPIGSSVHEYNSSRQYVRMNGVIILPSGKTICLHQYGTQDSVWIM